MKGWGRSISRCIGVLLSLFAFHDAWAVTGPEVAQLLNARYRTTVDACVGATPVYYCSGVLARRSASAQGVNFWMHGPEASASGEERSDYWRIDRDSIPADRPNGFIFTDIFTAIGAGKSLDVQVGDSDSAARIKNWNTAAPAQMPLQALFYEAGFKGALRWAQKDQRDYFLATGDWLPILRMQRDDAQQSPFGFNQGDQLYVGYQVAARLNARYADTSPVCRDGRAAFYCNGVMIRTTDQSTAFHSWNPSPGSVRGNGASFSYLRADTAVVRLYKPQGFIIREQAAPAGNPMTLRCAYPFDGGTGGSADTCRTHGGLCGDVGITSVAAWVARYAGNPNSTCAFNVDPQQFQLSVAVRQNRSDGFGWNEFMVGAWPQDNPSQLPIEAFIYTTRAYISGNGPVGALYDQKDFFQQTARYVPIIRVALDAPAGQVFVFNPQEQGVD